MHLLKISALTLSMLIISGCNDDKEHNKTTSDEQTYENFVLPTLNTEPAVRGQLFKSQYTTNSLVNITDTAGLSESSQSLENHSFRINDLPESQALENILIDARVCLDAALSNCIQLTHQLSGQYSGQVIPVDLRTTLIDLLIKHHSLSQAAAQTRINDYLQLAYDISATTIIPEQYVDQEKVLEDFAEAAMQRNISLDQYILTLANQIAQDATLTHADRRSSIFKPKITAQQLIEDVNARGTELSLLELFKSSIQQHNDTDQALISDRLRYLNATIDSMLETQVKLSELQKTVAPTLKTIETDYELNLMSINTEQLEEFSILVHRVIFDFNQLPYLSSDTARQKQIDEIELVLKHLMFKRDEITINLDQIYQGQIALQVVLATKLGITEENLKLIQQYISTYTQYYDHLNGLMYYLLAEDLKYHQDTLATCDQEETPHMLGELSRPHCSLYTEYQNARINYLNQDIPPLQLQGVAPIGGIGGLTPDSIPVMSSADLAAALLAQQTSRANTLENTLREQIQLVQQKNEMIRHLNSTLGLINYIKSEFPNAEVVDFSNKRLALSDQYQQELDTRENMTCTSSRCYSKRPIIDFGTAQEWEAPIQRLKNEIDNLSNTQQMDMLRLQSLTNKRNEAFEMMSNFLKKMQAQRANIIDNMR